MDLGRLILKKLASIACIIICLFFALYARVQVEGGDLDGGLLSIVRIIFLKNLNLVQLKVFWTINMRLKSLYNNYGDKSLSPFALGEEESIIE